MTARSSSFLIVLLISLAASAGDDLPVKPKAPAPAQRIFLDPVTGQPRSPTREERQSLEQQNAVTAPAKSEATAKSAETAKVVQYQDGSVGVFRKKPQNQIHVIIGKEGSVKTYCNDKPAQQAKP